MERIKHNTFGFEKLFSGGVNNISAENGIKHLILWTSAPSKFNGISLGLKLKSAIAISSKDLPDLYQRLVSCFQNPSMVVIVIIKRRISF